MRHSWLIQFMDSCAQPTPRTPAPTNASLAIVCGFAVIFHAPRIAGLSCVNLNICCRCGAWNSNEKAGTPSCYWKFGKKVNTVSHWILRYMMERLINSRSKLTEWSWENKNFFSSHSRYTRASNWKHFLHTENCFVHFTKYGLTQRNDCVIWRLTKFLRWANKLHLVIPTIKQTLK